jgi:hypothetical protein
MLVFVVALCMPFLSAQTENSASSKKDNSVYDELAKAPKKERARRNPLDKNFDVPHRAVRELIHQGGGAK